jgi:formaldehyde-activating enzyme
VAKKKSKKSSKSKGLKGSERIVLRTGEALVEGELDYLCAEPEIVIGELDGPVGVAIANLVGNQSAGHTKVFAILNSDAQVRPVTLMVSKVTVNNSRYTNILMGSVQAGIAHGVLDAVRENVIPKEKANELGLIYSVWLDPSVLKVPAGKVDHEGLFNIHRAATKKVIEKALANEPSIDWLLENQTSTPHYFHGLGLEGKI